ncbi:hypothetical protein KR074_007310 [Drosophila pseudoananassae]|nr:hypothetical protein KR074_007310 [Drosophila pseudoananassae]
MRTTRSYSDAVLKMLMVVAQRLQLVLGRVGGLLVVGRGRRQYVWMRLRLRLGMWVRMLVRVWVRDWMRERVASPRAGMSMQVLDLPRTGIVVGHQRVVGNGCCCCGRCCRRSAVCGDAATVTRWRWRRCSQQRWSAFAARCTCNRRCWLIRNCHRCCRNIHSCPQPRSVSCSIRWSL